jgi:hypothetical protein
MLLIILTLLLLLNIIGLIKRQKKWSKIFMILQVSVFLIFTLLVKFGGINKNQIGVKQTINSVKEILVNR